VSDNAQKKAESKEKQISISAENSSNLGVENSAVDSHQVKVAHSRNRDMHSGSAGSFRWWLYRSRSE